MLKYSYSSFITLYKFIEYERQLVAERPGGEQTYQKAGYKKIDKRITP